MDALVEFDLTRAELKAIRAKLAEKVTPPTAKEMRDLRRKRAKAMATIANRRK